MCSEAAAVREAGKVKQQQLQSKLEGIIDAVCFATQLYFLKTRYKVLINAFRRVFSFIVILIWLNENSG